MNMTLNRNDSCIRTSTRQRRLRILQVIETLNIGGAEQTLALLAQYIDTTRYELFVCSLFPVDAESPVVQTLRAHKIPIYCLGTHRKHSPMHIVQLIALVIKLRIDVVHTHLPYATIASCFVPCAIVSTLHNIQDSHRSFHRTKEFLQQQVLCWRARAVLACAPEVAVMARTRMHIPEHILKNVPYGIDVAAFSRNDPDAIRARRRALLGTAQGPLIITVGNLRVQKAQQYLVEAVPSIRAKFPEARIVIVGRDGENKELVEERIRTLGLQDSVTLLGQRSDIPELVGAADLFVMSSLWEGLPLAMLEAMAAGIPVVATSVGGIPGLLEDGKTGRLVPPADAAALASAMLDMLSNPEIAQRCASTARAQVQALYGVERWTQQLQDIYAAVSGRS